jgi:LPXTG-site transpeptidase (sortase) family protein
MTEPRLIPDIISIVSQHSLRKHNLRTLSNFMIAAGFLLLWLTFGAILKDEAWFYLKEAKGQKLSLFNREEDAIEDSVFARFLTSRPIFIEPVNKDFSIVIERIGVNAPIVADVSITDEKAYNEALRTGIAHASTSKYPSNKPGNVYLFAHASINFWRLGKYANVFNLVRKLDLGDRIHIFYKGDPYVYEVVNKETMKGWNTYPITRSVVEPILTLQTCDPPGTTLNRMVVTAKLIKGVPEEVDDAIEAK